MDKPLAIKVRNLITYIGNALGFQLVAAPDCPYRNHIGALLTGCRVTSWFKLSACCSPEGL